MDILNKLKSVFNNNSIQNQINSANNLIAEIKRLNIQYEYLENSKINLEHEALNLQTQLDPTLSKDMNHIEKNSIKVLTRIEEIIDAQIKIIETQVALLQQFIELEYDLLIYQINRPITLFNEYINLLNELITNKELIFEENLKQELEQIISLLQTLINNAINHIQKETVHYSQFINKTPSKIKDGNPSLFQHLESRQNTEKQIDKKIESGLDSIKHIGENPENAHHNFISALNDIIILCESRLKYSDEIIIAAFTLQSETYHKIDEIKSSIDTIQINIIKRIELFDKNKITPFWITDKITARLKELESFMNKIKLISTNFKFMGEQKLIELKDSENKNVLELNELIVKNKEELKQGFFNPSITKKIAAVLLALSLTACNTKQDQKYTPNINQITNYSSANILKKTENGDLTILNFSSEDAACAEYVKKVYEKIYGKNMPLFTGVYGNAWDFPKNITFLGGKIIWKDDGKNKLDPSILQKGDIIGFKYKYSSFLETARTKGEDFTHLMIVIEVKNGKPIFAHYYKPGKRALRWWKTNKHLLTGPNERIDNWEKINALNDLFKPIKVMRALNSNPDYTKFTQLEKEINSLNKSNFLQVKQSVDYFKQSKYKIGLNDFLENAQQKIDRFELSIKKTAKKISNLQKNQPKNLKKQKNHKTQRR